MTIRRISEEEFNSLAIDKMGVFPECSWFRSSALNIAGTVIRDPFDKDWSYVVVSKDEDSLYRYIKGEVSIDDQNLAEQKLIGVMADIETRGTVEEELFKGPDDDELEDAAPLITTIDDGIKSYFKRHPEKLYQLPPRRFEELVADILKDLGFDVELTQATRDGGRDIIAYVRTAVCSYLTHIECKRYSASNKVGVGVIREVLGVHQIRQASKSVIVTTSFFTEDARKEAEVLSNQLDLKDFNNLRDWLQRY